MSNLRSLVCRCLIAGASGAVLLSSSAYAAPYDTNTTCDQATSASRSCTDNGTTVDVVKAKQAIGLGGATKPVLTDCSQVEGSSLTAKDIKMLLGSDGLVDVSNVSKVENVGLATFDLPDGESLKIVFDRTSGEQLAVIRTDADGDVVARVDYVTAEGTRCHKVAGNVSVDADKPTTTATTPATTTTTTPATTSTTTASTTTATTAPTSSRQTTTTKPVTKPTATSVAPAKPTYSSPKATTSPTNVTKSASSSSTTATTSPTTSASPSKSTTPTTAPSQATSTTAATAKPAAETSGKQLAKTGGPVKAALLIAGALLSGGGALIYGARRGFSLR